MSKAYSAYLDMFDSRTDAIEFEHNTLLAGDEFLPRWVIAVRDGNKAPTARYWEWLADQAEES